MMSLQRGSDGKLGSGRGGEGRGGVWKPLIILERE